jgi:hypothetical protein
MKQGRKKVSLANPFPELTWIDIQEWAGSKILSRGKSYQRTGCVRTWDHKKERDCCLGRGLGPLRDQVRLVEMLDSMTGKRIVDE